VGTNKLYLVYEYEQYKALQDIREIELRDSGSNTNTKICFDVRATALRLRLHTEGLPLCPHRTFSKGSPLRNYNSTPGAHNSSLNTNTYTQEVKHKA